MPNPYHVSIVQKALGLEYASHIATYLEIVGGFLGQSLLD
jgi:hypothetical protein